MIQEIKVGISDYKVTSPPNTLITLGLGSCVGIAIYDKRSQRGGLSHIMLPDSTLFSRNVKTEKFADLAIPAMVKEISQGGTHRGLIAKIAGGASMFNFTDEKNGNIGYRNVLAVEAILKEMGIPVLGKHTGGNSGRTMIVDLSTFDVTVRMINREIITL